MPTLAVIIPAKNEEHYLPRVLEALRKQTRQPDELVVADARSTDATAAIARQYGAKVVKGGMPGVGRNRGVKATTSELLFFLDADVVITDNRFIEKAVAEYERRKLDIACADVRVVGGNRYDVFSAGFYNWYTRMLADRRPHLTGFCILMRRAVFKKLRGFDEEVKFAEDTEMGLRAHKAGFRFGILDTVVIGVTTRRQDRDGRLRMTLVYALAEPYMMVFGPIKSDVFNYRFDYDEKKVRT